MANVLAFPERNREWEAIEKKIRAAVLKAGGSSEMFTFLCERLKADFDAIDSHFDVLVPPGCEDLMKDAVAAFRERLSAMFQRLLLAHADLHLAQTGRIGGD